MKLSITLTLFAVSIAGCGGEPSDPPSPDGGADDASADAALPVDSIEWGTCPDSFREQCAVLQMPLDHDDPDGEKIDVFISRRGTGSRQLWLLQGGPGASAESFFGLHDFLTMVDPELEVYTIEHRGVGDSSRLGCSGEDEDSDAGFQITLDEWPACQDEVRETYGDRLAFFDTKQAAHDLADAIELTRRPDTSVFIYGGSYGTYWANRFGVLHPEASDGIILDAPVQPDGYLDGWDLAFDPIGRRVFGELCPLAPRCMDHLGPDPLAFLDRVVADLAEGQCAELGVDIDTWQLVFGLFLMDYNLRNWLPALIYRLDRCELDDRLAIGTLFTNLFSGGDGGLPRTSKVLQVNIVLSELWPREHVDDADVVAARESATFFQDGIAQMYLLQDTWPRYEQDPRGLEYVPPEVPVLTMAGSFDPAAPPWIVGYGYRDNLTGPHQTFVEIPYGAHTVLTGGFVSPEPPLCSVQLVRAFLDDPSATLPVECAESVESPTFDALPQHLDRYWGANDLYD